MKEQINEQMHEIPPWTNQQARDYYQSKLDAMQQTQDEMKRINSHVIALRRSVAGNEFLIHSLNSVLQYMQQLIGLAVDYGEMLLAARDQLGEDDDEA